ncbi:MAG: SufE family protein [Candidatus Promineifilaceae bacterium]|jgi:cysteine desulfuration protein SufE
MNELPPRLLEIVQDFEFLQGPEKLEYLLELSENLAPLPEWLLEDRENMDEVHECMTPVFIFAESENRHLHFHLDIPRESPTVRGFGAILQQGLDGSTAQQITAVPNEFYLQMGLQEVLSGQRLNGIGAILRHMKTLAQTTE